MGRRITTWGFIFVALLAVFAVQFAGAGPSFDQKAKRKVLGSTFLSPVDPFTGRIKTKGWKDCLGPRQIRFFNADTGAILTRTTTDKQGNYSKPFPFFSGGVFAQAPQVLGGCPRTRPSLVRRFGKATTPANTPTAADLAVNKVYLGDDGSNALWTITVTNLGPGPANGVVAYDYPGYPASAFVAAGSDPRCAPAGDAQGSYTCPIGTLAAGSATALLVKTTCNPASVVNTAAVQNTADLGADPNSTNDNTGPIPSGPCPA
jgi:hypothetical protein